MDELLLLLLAPLTVEFAGRWLTDSTIRHTDKEGELVFEPHK